MSDMGSDEAAGAPLRRARTSAWIVTVVMGSTTMAFQVYHSVKFGHMPWELAVLYGVAPLLIAVLVLEIVAEWRDAPWPAKAGAYLIMGAAMFLSASATGDVVLAAAPPHFSLLFGALLDGAELLAAYFIMNGPSAAQAVAAVARREAELLAAADAERSSRERDNAAHQAAMSDLRARAGTEIEARDQALADAAEALAIARSDAEKAAAKTAVLERKLGGPARRSRTAPARPGTAPRSSTETAPEDDVELEARALKLLATDLTMSGAELARQLGVSEGYGRKLRRRLGPDRPAEDEADRPEDRTGTASGDRGEDRS
jgi:hypothetical protein